MVLIKKSSCHDDAAKVSGRKDAGGVSVLS